MNKPTPKKRPKVVRLKPRDPDPQPKLSDAEPTIVQLLRQVKRWGSSNGGERDKVLASVNMVLAMWDAHEDIEELRAALGLKAVRPKKRKRTAVDRDFEMAFALAVHRARGTEDAATIVADEFSTDSRTVERAFKEWGALRLRELDKVRTLFGPEVAARLRYSSPKRDEK
jgi:hypothetical protein